MAKALTAARAGFRRLFSISAFTPPPPATVPPPAEPSPNLFISGLSKRTTSEGLREAFSKFGNLIHARVVTDRVSGYSKGFGFVRYATVEEAAEGIKGMDGKFLDGWVIFAEYAKPRAQPSQVESSQSLQNTTTSAPPPNYTSQTPQSWSSYRPSPPSEPPSSYSSYNRASDPPSSNSSSSNPPLSYSSYMPPTSEPPPSYSSYTPPSNYYQNSPQTPQSNSSVPPPNYSPPSSPPSSRFESVQSTNYSQSSEFQQGNAWAPPSWNPSASQPPNYAPSSYASAQTFNRPPQASHPAYSPMHGTPENVSSYASAPPSDSPQNSGMNSDNQTSESSCNFDSGRAAQY